jgi:hypothetical protein
MTSIVRVSGRLAVPAKSSGRKPAVVNGRTGVDKLQDSSSEARSAEEDPMVFQSLKNKAQSLALISDCGNRRLHFCFADRERDACNYRLNRRILAVDSRTGAFTVAHPPA